jgi:hypothetical protein
MSLLPSRSQLVGLLIALLVLVALALFRACSSEAAAQTSERLHLARSQSPYDVALPRGRP